MNKPIQFQERLIEEVVAESDAEIETLIGELDRNHDSTIERGEVADENDSLVFNDVTQSWSPDQYERVEQLLLEKGLVGQKRIFFPPLMKPFEDRMREERFSTPRDDAFHSDLFGLGVYNNVYSSLPRSDRIMFGGVACSTAGEDVVVSICGTPFVSEDWLISVSIPLR